MLTTNAQESRPHMRSSRSIATPILTGALCFVLAFAMIHFLSFRGNLASVWPANAVILAQLLGRPRREWGRFLICGFAAIAAGSALARGSVVGPVGLALANTIEIALAAALLRGRIEDGRLLHHHASVGRFVFCAGIVAPAFGAFLSAAIAAATLHVQMESALVTKFSADALGLLIFTPFLFALYHGGFAESLRAATRWERAQMLALHAATLAISLGVFGQDRYPLLFLPMVPLMAVAFRFGWQGTSLGVMVVAVTGGVATFHGHGPISLSGNQMPVQLAFLQFYLGTMVMLMMPVAAALTARRDLIERLRESERSLQLLADRSAIVLLRFSVLGACTRVVGDATALTGQGAQALVGAHLAAIDPPLGEALLAAHRRAMAGEASVTVEVERTGGVWLEVTFRVEREEHGAIAGSVATLVDVTARKAREGELARLAETDELTGLANRAGFLRRFEAALTDPPLTGISVALIDVDRFKSLNDEMGHVAGDAVLAEIGRRIALSVRGSDVVARLGGDEFVVMLGTGDPDVASEVCARIVDAVSAAPVALPLGGQAQARISCGLVHGEAGQRAIDLLNRADMALYAAKRGGRNQLIAA